MVFKKWRGWLHPINEKHNKMITREEVFNGEIYRYYYDRSLKLWTVYVIDSEGNQVSEEAEHYQNKTQMLDVFDFKKL